ncbi:TOBE domain-containing protein, partial [Actinomyces sp. MRS3W]|uniref:TOBE domain-containing protein n=1 Tax=Actinomyces sp. MRS3W TaxID=2800796 RepID=UPI0028FD7C0A
ALARALATSPRVLVLDEPMSALDVTARQQLRELLARRAREERLTVLLVTHDVVDVAALADEVVVLEAGRVVESGPAARVLTAPTSRFGARLSGMSVLPGTIDGDAQSPGLVLDGGTRLAARPGLADLPPAGQPGLALIPPDAVALYRAERPDVLATGADADPDVWPGRAASGPATGGSPRNALPGTVTGVDPTGGLVTVTVRVVGGHLVTATVTAAAVAELGLRPGAAVTCVIKAVQIRLVPRRGDRSPHPNRH